MVKIIYNGKIYLDRSRFCEALLVDGGRIVKTGSSKDILDAAPLKSRKIPVEKINADGTLVVPAFYDSHLHLMWVGRRMSGIECAGAKSVDDVICRGRETIARLHPRMGACILGSGLDPDRFSEGEKRDLNRDDLDKITTEYPLVVSRHCGHTIYCNSLALKTAGLSESAPNIEGGVIEKDKNGKPTGVLRENAGALVKRKMPPSSVEEIKEHIRLAMQKAHSLGITSCGSYDINGHDFDTVVKAYCQVYDECKRAGFPGLRVSMQCGISGSEEILTSHLERKTQSPFWEDKEWGAFLKMQSIKLFADGTLGGQTAWLRQPYLDNQNTPAEHRFGLPLIQQEKLENFVQKAAAGGMQVLVHAIGDAGMDAVLCAFEKVTAPGKNPLRHGIIHCQITSPDLLERMARNKIPALVQPGFLEDDMHILESRVGKERALKSYAWGSMQKLGVPVSYSTDAPVSDINPFHCINWAVNRGGYNGDERVDIYSAVDAYTSACAFSGFNENVLGRIKPGAFADLVFLDRDVFSTPVEDIAKTKVLRTICAGETVYGEKPYTN